MKTFPRYPRLAHAHSPRIRRIGIAVAALVAAAGTAFACSDSGPSEPPDLKEPEKCPETDCNCPSGPGSTPNCLEDLIAKQAADIAAAKKAEAFKKDLEDLLNKAKAANQDYTRAKYESLIKQWVELDGCIAAFIRKFECALPCWR